MPNTEDMTTPTGLRIVRESEHAQILDALKDSKLVQDHLRNVQAEHGALLQAVVKDSETTATGMIRLVALQEERNSREASADARAQARADKPWAWVADNWRLVAGGGVVVTALLAGNPEVIELVGRYLGVPPVAP